MMRPAIIFSLFLILTNLTACSAGYLAKASYEEAKIILGKEKITKLLSKSETPKNLKKTLMLVESVREFSKEENLKPSGSYEDYYDIGRDVLVWVLSASKKDSLDAHTWWFPVVGRVPYKGFFNKEDGLEYAKNLSKEKNLDYYLRPSPAFSTLGWLNDPFLSTMKSDDEISVVNTLIHEIFHNTLWIKGSVSFNETMANIAGAAGSIAFFEKRDGKDSKLAREAKNRLEDERVYAKYLIESLNKVQEFYKTEKESSSSESFLGKRDKLFDKISSNWEEKKSQLKTKAYQNANKTKLNNSVLLARKVYYDRYEDFYNLYKLNNKDFAEFLKTVLEINEKSKESGQDIWLILKDKIDVDKFS